MIAELQSYDWPETVVARDAFWGAWRDAMRERGLDAPDKLDHSRAHGQAWHDPELLVGQTCGYPYMLGLRGIARLVATPVYSANGCNGPAYCSWVVVHRSSDAQTIEDQRGRSVAYNSKTSHSGYNALRALIAPIADNGTFFSKAVCSGGHANSLEMVAAQEVDCAATDAICWAMTQRYRPEIASELKVLTSTPSAPSLPYITAANRSDKYVQIIQDALQDALNDAALADARSDLFLAGAEILDEGSYQVCLDMERDAAANNYAVLG